MPHVKLWLHKQPISVIRGDSEIPRVRQALDVIVILSVDVDVYVAIPGNYIFVAILSKKRTDRENVRDVVAIGKCCPILKDSLVDFAPWVVWEHVTGLIPDALAAAFVNFSPVSLVEFIAGVEKEEADKHEHRDDTTPPQRRHVCVNNLEPKRGRLWARMLFVSDWEGFFSSVAGCCDCMANPIG